MGPLPPRANGRASTLQQKEKLAAALGALAADPDELPDSGERGPQPRVVPSGLVDTAVDLVLGPTPERANLDNLAVLGDGNRLGDAGGMWVPLDVGPHPDALRFERGVRGHAVDLVPNPNAVLAELRPGVHHGLRLDLPDLQAVLGHVAALRRNTLR